MNISELRKKARASMLSAAIGDFFGSAYEFMSAEQIELYQSSQGAKIRKMQHTFTDDTQLMLFCAEGIARYAAKHKCAPLTKHNVK